MKVGEHALIGIRPALRVRAEGDIDDYGVAWKTRTVTQDLGERQIVRPDERQPFVKALELLLQLSMPELSHLPGPQHHEDLPGLGKQPQGVIDESGKIVDDRNGSLVLAERCIAKKSLIDGRQQERDVGKKLLSMPAREDRRRAGDSDNEIWFGTIGERRADVVDDCLIRRADESCRSDDDLNDVHRALGALVQVDAKVAGEVVDRQAATVERLQHQDLLGLGRRRARRSTEHQPSRQRRTLEPDRDPQHLRSNMIARRFRSMHVVIAVVLALLCTAAPAGAQPTGELAGSVFDQTGAALRGVHVAIRGVTDRRAETSAAGDVAFTNLPEGDYEISVELSGFERQGRAVRVRPGERATVSFTLRVAAAAQTIVTAAKAGGRDLQEIPIGITAVSHDNLDRLGTQTIEEAPVLAPSVTFSQNTGWGQLTIRGIGTNVVFAGSDPSSAIYLDGVYLARPAMAFARFLDLDRIEVLRGPQGTLYGRNAVGGAMNLVPRPPTNDLQASARFTAGNFGQLRADARMSGPLKRDKIMGSIALARGVRDGYVRDLDHPDHPLGGDNDTAARGQLRVVFDRRTSVLLSADVDQQRGIPLTYNKVLVAKPGYQFDNPADFHDVRTSLLAWNDTLHYGGTARLTMALAPATTLVSLTAFRALDYEFVADSDSTELDLVRTHQLERQHQLSQEITVSHQQSRLTWVAGMFLFSESDHQTVWSFQPAGPFERRLDPRVDATSRAVFGQATVGLTSRLSATAGVRYTHEGKDIDNAGGRYGLEAPNSPVPGSVYGYSDAIANGAWTPKFGLEMKLSDGSLAYVSATRGFKSGGFNPSSTAPGRGYDPEWAWSYEGGWKGTLIGGRSRFATSAFVMDYTNLQVQTPIGIGVLDIRNAAAATIRGIEVEEHVPDRTRHHCRRSSGLARCDLRPLHRGFRRRHNRRRLGQPFEQRPGVGGAPVDRLDRRGRSFAPAARLSRVHGAIDGLLHAVQRSDPVAESVRPAGRPGRMHGSADRRWTFGAYARNLTNSDYVTATFGTPPNAYAGRPGPSRQFAVDFTVRR